jgi:hypothetical protein
MAHLVNRDSRSGELSEEGRSPLHVGGVNALGEPTVNRGQQLAGFLYLSLLLPQPAETYRHGMSTKRLRGPKDASQRRRPGTVNSLPGKSGGTSWSGNCR